MGVNGSHPWTAWWTTPPHRHPLRPRPAPHRSAAACPPRPSTGPPRAPGSAPRARHHACSRCQQRFRHPRRRWRHGRRKGATRTAESACRRTPCTADSACHWAQDSAGHHAPPSAAHHAHQDGLSPLRPCLQLGKRLPSPGAQRKSMGESPHPRRWARPLTAGRADGVERPAVDPCATPRRGGGGAGRRPAPGRPSARRTGGRALFRGGPGRAPAPLRRGAPGRAGARATVRPGPAAPPRAHCPGAPPVPTTRTARP